MSRPTAPAKPAGPAAPANHPTVCLGFETAVLYWRAVHERRLPFPAEFEPTELPQACATGYRGLKAIDLSALGVRLQPGGISARFHTERVMQLAPDTNQHVWVERLMPDGLAIPPGSVLPLHVLTSRQANRSRIHCLRTHLVPKKLPPHSFYRITDEIIVSSPELTFVHLSRALRTLPCLELLCEWCGTYALSPLADDCHFGCCPITDHYRIERYLSHGSAPRGSGTVGASLVWATEGLASTRETELFLMLTLPTRLGGFALPTPYVNQQIPLKSTEFAGLSGHAFFLVDLFWPDERVIVEYDGLEDHEKTPLQIAADKERRSVLAAMGYTVIVVTKRDVGSLSALNRKVRQVALALGLELADATESELGARVSLFNWLFDARHDHVPFGFGYR